MLKLIRSFIGVLVALDGIAEGDALEVRREIISCIIRLVVEGSRDGLLRAQPLGCEDWGRVSKGFVSDFDVRFRKR